MNEQPRPAIALQWLTMMFRRVTAVLLTLRVRTVCWQLVWATLAAEISKSASSCLYTSWSITVSVWEERRCYRVPFARALPGSGGACGRNRPHALASESLPSLAPSRSARAAGEGEEGHAHWHVPSLAGGSSIQATVTLAVKWGPGPRLRAGSRAVAHPKARCGSYGHPTMPVGFNLKFSALAHQGLRLRPAWALRDQNALF